MSVGHHDHILLTLQLDTAWWSMWRGNHLVPCVTELLGSCVLIHAYWPGSSWFKVPLLSVWSVAVPLWIRKTPICVNQVETWSRCPTDIETLSLADILQLCRVRSFYITDCTDWVNLFNTVSAVVSLQWFRPSHRSSSVLNPVTNSFYMKFYMKFVMYSLYCSAE